MVENISSFEIFPSLFLSIFAKTIRKSYSFGSLCAPSFAEDVFDELPEFLPLQIARSIDIELSEFFSDCLPYVVLSHQIISLNFVKSIGF
jgi:hypothetical protein